MRVAQSKPRAHAPATARKNSVQMVTLASRMTEDEMKAVADYIAGLK